MRFELRDNPRYKRKEIFLFSPEGRIETECRWVCWKLAVVKGGNLKRLALEESHKGEFWKLVHKNRAGKGWHQQGKRARKPGELAEYAWNHDFNIGKSTTKSTLLSVSQEAV